MMIKILIDEVNSGVVDTSAFLITLRGKGQCTGRILRRNYEYLLHDVITFVF